MIEEILWEGEGAPTWLETPVTEVPALKPPTDTRAQLLPLIDLAWEHFERLCLRYVRMQSVDRAIADRRGCVLPRGDRRRPRALAGEAPVQPARTGACRLLQRGLERGR